MPDEEEESYFNGDDDDDDLLPLPEISPRHLQQRPTSPSIPVSNALKRKRRPAVGAATKGYRPPLRTPSFTQLVDYAEDENEDAALDASSQISPSSPSLLSSPLPISTDGPPSSPKLFHRQVSTSLPSGGPPPKRPKEEEDDEDNLLEALARARSRPPTPTPGMMASSAGLMRPSEKRRRGFDDDDDEEGLERLTKASKKMDGGAIVQKAPSPSPSLGRRTTLSPSSPSPSSSSSSSGSAQVLQPETTTMAAARTTEMPFSLTGAVPSRPALLRTKSGEEPPKQRYKLKIGPVGVVGAAMAASPPAPPTSQSEAGVKDGDTG